MDNLDQIQKVKNFEGAELQKKLFVGPKMGQGSFGTVHKVIGTIGSNSQKLVVKASEDIVTTFNEVHALDQVHKHAESQGKYKHVADSVPKALLQGLIYVEKELQDQNESCSGNRQLGTSAGANGNKNGSSEDDYTPLVYYIMPRYGLNLQEILESRGNYLNNASIFGLGLQLLDILELVHDSGLVYNDLKPDNIMIGTEDKLPSQMKSQYDDIFKNVRVNLVDFGLASKWLDNKTGKHCKRKDLEYFQGNMFFSSVNQLAPKTASRRDDLHSLLYLMIYLINRCSIPALDVMLLNESDDIKAKLD